MMTGSTHAADEPAKKLYHVVALKFKEDATKEQIKVAEDAFVALKTKIPGIASLTWGTNVSPEMKNKGLTHCFVMTFNTEKERDAYLPHPAHQEFVALLQNKIEAVLVIDYWAAA